MLTMELMQCILALAIAVLWPQYTLLNIISILNDEKFISILIQSM